MSKIKVLHLTVVHPSNDVRIYEKEAVSLCRKGYKVTIAGPMPPPNCKDISWIKLPTPIAFRPMRVCLSQIFAFYAVLRSRAKVVHFHDPELLIFGNLLRLFSRRLLVWDAHEDYYSQIIRWGIRENIFVNKALIFASKAISQILDLTSRTFDGIVGATPQICGTYTNKQTHLVGNEVILQNFVDCSPTFESQQIFLLSNSSNDPIIIEVAKCLISVPDVKFVVAGKQFDSAIICGALSILGNRITFHSRLSRDELKQIIGTSTIALVVYTDVQTHHTNSPNKFFEFAAAGLPVVCTPNPSLRQLLAKSESGVSAHDFSAEGLVSASQKILRSRSQWLKFSLNGKNWARTSGSWEASEANLIALYDVLTSKLKSD